MGASGLAVILIFAHILHLGPGATAGLGAGSLTQTSMMGTASGALEQLGLAPEVLKQEQASIAAGYAVTYVCGYVLVLLFVPLIAPRLMGVDLKQEAQKLEAALSGNAAAKPGQLLYRKFQARAYRVTAAAGRSVGDIRLGSGGAPSSSAFCAANRTWSARPGPGWKTATKSSSPGRPAS
jgi:uncharacterized transporter YbjL